MNTVKQVQEMGCNNATHVKGIFWKGGREYGGLRGLLAPGKK
jgi:hypothetical protein